MSSGIVTRGNLPDGVHFNSDGLVPVVVQEFNSREVLMLAWMDAEAIRRTLEHTRVTYFSRSRGEYWRKGDTSGNIQHAVSMALDCDGDSILLEVNQTGPACHTGALSCFEVHNA